MLLCGLPGDDEPNPNPDNLLSSAATVASEVFMGTFEKCLDMTFSDLEKEPQLISRQPDVGIFTSAGTRTKLKAFIEWTKQCFHYGLHPEETVFNPDTCVELIRMANLHQDFITRSKLMAATAKPPQFKPTDDFASSVAWTGRHSLELRYSRSGRA